MSIIEAKNVCKTFGKERVLKDISLVVNEAEYLAIIGPSGSGKSTLLHILGGMDTQDSGEVLFAGQNTRQLSRQQLAEIRNQKFGFVFQFFYLEPHLTVAENLEIPLFLGKLKKTERKNRVNIIAAAVGTEKLLNKFPRQLSGGEQQRVAIGRAIINYPRVLFLDEPTGNLDSENTTKIISLIKTLQIKYQFTIIMITHDINVARVADRIVKIEDGKIC